jgi:hypothetical protein
LVCLFVIRTHIVTHQPYFSHIDFHLDAYVSPYIDFSIISRHLICSGLAVVFAEDAAGTAAHSPAPRESISGFFENRPNNLNLSEAWSELCPKYEEFLKTE